MNWKSLAAVGLALFMACPLLCGATGVKATGKSSFGGSMGSLTPDGTPTSLGGGFSAGLDDSFSDGTDSFLEIDTPGSLVAGTLITISGLGTLPFSSVYCSPTSFLGTCDPDGSTPLTTAQSNCLGTIDEENPSAGTFTFTVPTCNITGNNSMVLIFGDGSTSLTGFNLSGIDVSTGSASMPEPSSLVLLGGGLVGLVLRRRSLRQNA